MHAAAWKSLPDGHWESCAGMMTDQTCESKSLKREFVSSNIMAKVCIVLLAVNIIRQRTVGSASENVEESVVCDHWVSISSGWRQSTSQNVLIRYAAPSKTTNFSFCAIELVIRLHPLLEVELVKIVRDLKTRLTGKDVQTSTSNRH